MPVILVPRALLSLLSLLILGSAIYLLWSWAHGLDIRDIDGVVRHVHGPAWRLYTGLAFSAWSVAGRSIVLLFIPAGDDEPREERGQAYDVTAPDGSELHVEVCGLEQGPTLVLTHGWGLNSTAWWYTKHALQDRFRLVTWDLPGLGRSKPPKDGLFTIDGFAQALGAVVDSVGGKPVVLVGHSIGGMTTQTFWRACSPETRARVAGVVLVDTTHEDPIQTMWLSPLWRALRKPLIEPMMGVMIALFPLVWLSSWQSYLSGSSQLAMRLTGFGRHATRGQVDFTARLACKGSPAVQAKGNLAMFRWKATEVLGTIPVPVLVLAGSRDIVTLPAASAFIAASTPQGRSVVLDGAGPMGFMERAEAYDKAIAEFATALMGGAATPRQPARP